MDMVPIVNTEVSPAFRVVNSPIMSVLRVTPAVASPSVTRSTTTGRPGVRVTCEIGSREFRMSVSPRDCMPSIKLSARARVSEPGAVQSSKQNSAVSRKRITLKRSRGWIWFSMDFSPLRQK